jgi:signal transduction histidine kinase
MNEVPEKIREGKTAFNISYLILTSLLLVTIGATYMFYSTARAKDSIRFQNEVDRIESAVDYRVRNYTSMLLGARGFIQSTGDLDRQKFKTFAESLDLQKNFSGIRRLGFIRSTRSDDSDGPQSDDSTVANNNTARDILVYAEPETPAVLRIIGFDLSLDEKRRSLLNIARDTGRPVASGKIVPLDAEANTDVSIVAILIPVYESAETPLTLEDRRDLVRGYVYGAFEPASFLSEVVSETHNNDISITIYDDQALQENLLAETGQAPAARNDLNSDVETMVGGRTWTIRYTALPSYANQSSARWSPIIFLAGTVFSFLIFGITYREAQTRARFQRSADELRAARDDRERLFRNEKMLRLAAERANIAKDEFISVISHELKTPLNAVAGWARILQSEDVTPATRQSALQKIEKNVRSQSDLIQQLLDYSDLLAEGADLTGKTANVTRIFDNAIARVMPAADDKNVSLVMDNSVNGRVIRGDEEKLQMVFENILSNAVKFTPSGGRIDASLGESGGFVAFNVKDTGVGIGPEFLDKIYERYKQEQGPFVRRYGGLGLGLTISKHIVQLHDGSIDVRSEGKEKGTEVTVKLPFGVE